MPNWCSTNLKIYSIDHSAIRDIHSKLNCFIQVAYDDKVNDSSWLGNICLHSGFTYDNIINNLASNVRGWVQWIYDVEKLNNVYFFSVDVEDAWYAHIYPWRAIIEALYPNKDIKIAWIATESGCDIYHKYDPDGLFYNEYEYNVDSYFPTAEEQELYPALEDGEQTCSTDLLLHIFQATNIEDAYMKAEAITDSFEETYGEGYINIHHYEEMNEEY